MKTHSPKICHVTIGHGPLDDRIFYKEVRSLAKKYRDITVVAPERIPLTKKDRVQFRLFRESGFRGNLIQAYNLAKQIKADLYHIHEFDFLPLALLLKYVYGAKIIYDAHETIYWYFREFSRHSHLITFIPALLAQGLEWGCAHFCDRVITVSPCVARGFEPFHKKINLIYNYPILELFSKHTQVQSKAVLLYHGQLVPARNIDVMIAAMAAVKTRFAGARLRLIGSITPDYRRWLENLICQHQVEGMVQIEAPVPYEQVPALVHTAAIGLAAMMPNESFKRSVQIKPFEFMASGVPVVACRVPSTELYVERSGAGVLVDPPTAENLGQTLIQLLNNPRQRREMGQRGKQAVRQNYNWSKMEPELLRIYSEVLEC